MKKSKESFVIPFVGLKLGIHHFDFDIDKAFFEGIDDTLIEDATVKAVLVLDKKETMMIAEFSIEGHIFSPCDRCNDLMEIPVENQQRIVYKFGTEDSGDENLIVLQPEAYEINVSEPLYELLVLSIPLRKIHDEGECNEEVMQLYNQYIVNANEPDDWDDDFDEDEDWDDDDFDDFDETDDSEDSDDDKPIDPRWSQLKNLN